MSTVLGIVAFILIIVVCSRDLWVPKRERSVIHTQNLLTNQQFNFSTEISMSCFLNASKYCGSVLKKDFSDVAEELLSYFQRI